VGANADLAWSYFELLGEGRQEEAHALLDDAGTYWQNGTRTTVPMAQMKALARKVTGALPLPFTLVSSHEAGDTVVLELESHGSRPDGLAYENVYCFLITVADGRILHLREHADTVAAAELLRHLDPPTRSEQH
jgi:ketosteroid isomerase-like protein